MSNAEIEKLEAEHYVNLRGNGGKIVCTHLNGSGRTKVFRIHPDGRIEVYAGGRFVQLPVEQARVLQRRLQQQRNVPCFSTSTWSIPV